MKPGNSTDIAHLTRKERKDLKVLALFTSVYCRDHHPATMPRDDAEDDSLARLGLGRYRVCADCREFLVYAVHRRLVCPLDPKPVCKHCQVHCYRPGHRDRVREVMRYSGRQLIRRGRLDLLWHYLF